ncbi:MAG: AraC family transcriptional regulator [Butyrivibrio sp.]|nr:AraC family transcriptional regulator [Acetatifactor muris]MCM1558826.1 AraC family transcriptional regulator [Butyrivibrio sp.]
MREIKKHRLEATDERQYMIQEGYEVYEKQGAPLGALAFHYHSFYEIIYVLEGEYSSMLENQTYHMKKGDFLLIDCNVMHKYHFIEKKHDSSRRIILWVTREMLQSLSGESMDLSACFHGQNSCAYHFPIYYEEMLRGYLLKLVMAELPDVPVPEVKQVLDRGCLTLLFGWLNVLCPCGEYGFSRENMVFHPMVEQVADYIDRHIGGGISVEELADYVHLSKYYFLRKFKEQTGVTVHNFVLNKRLIQASGELLRGKSLTETWQNAGFTDYSSFLRNFRKAFGVPPGKYREQMISPLSSPAAVPQ